MLPVVIVLSLADFFSQNLANISTEVVNEESFLAYENTSPNDDTELISAELALSSGFYDKDFEAKLIVSGGIDPLQIEIDTEYKRALQYTVSDIEGIIYRKGKFLSNSTLDFNSLRPGRYAVFVFAGRRIIRAFMVEKNLEKGTLF